MVYDLEVGSESCSSEMLQEQLDALLADGEATSQQQQVRAYGVLGSRAEAHIAFSLPSPPPPSLLFAAGQTGLCSAGHPQSTRIT